MNQNTATKSRNYPKASHEVHSEDGFYSAGTLTECKRAANGLAAKGVQCFVYAAGDYDKVIYDPCE